MVLVHDSLSVCRLSVHRMVQNIRKPMSSLLSNLEIVANELLMFQQADHLRQQTLQRMSCILTTRQAARGLLAFGEYFQRLRALSSLWAARPREQNV